MPEKAQYSGQTLTQERTARMNDCDNTAGLPGNMEAVRLDQTEARDGNLLSKLIGKMLQNKGD